MPPCGTAKLYINIMCKMYACHVGYKSVIYVTEYTILYLMCRTQFYFINNGSPNKEKNDSFTLRPIL